MADNVSRFLPPGATYVDRLATYLHSRGLSIQDIDCVPITARSMGLFAESATGQPFIPEGWGFKIRGYDGEYVPDQYLMRVCNWPPETTILFQRGEVYEDRPKFVQCGPKLPITHFCGGQSRWETSDVVALHEKITSAELCWQRVGIPSVAVSGCTGWGRSGELHPALATAFKRLPPNSTIFAHFDKDLETNPGIRTTAGQFKSALGRLRADIRVVFPSLPPSATGAKDGWDDWFVATGFDAAAWAALLEAEGVSIDEALSLRYLIEAYGVSVTGTGDSGMKLEQTLDNYLRLLAYPQWQGLTRDLTGDLYRGNDPVRGLNLENDFVRWLERTVCRGYGGKISKGAAQNAVESYLNDNTRCMALTLAKHNWPAPTLEECINAAGELFGPGGWQATGPLHGDELQTTVLRMFRDMARRWSGEGTTEQQWMLAIVGPSGCGKSTLINRIMAPLTSLGLIDLGIGDLDRIRPDKKDYIRVFRDCRFAFLDDMNSNMIEHDARQILNLLFTLTSWGSIMQRELYQRHVTRQQLHAAPVLTSVDRKFIRTSPGAGERRIIPVEFSAIGTTTLADPSRVLLAGMAHGVLATIQGDATEYSQKYVRQYVQDTAAVGELSSKYINFDHALVTMREWHRPATNDYRFSLPMLMRALGAVDSRYTGRSREIDLLKFFTGCGVVEIGKARVCDQGKEVLKDRAFSVDSVEKFLDMVRAAL